MKNSVAIFEEKLNVLENTNTNWTVRKEPLVSQVGNKPTSIYGIFRSDNGQFLGNVKERYTCYQNHEMLDLLFDTTSFEVITINKLYHKIIIHFFSNKDNQYR